MKKKLSRREILGEKRPVMKRVQFILKERIYLRGPKVLDSLDKLFGPTPRSHVTWTNRL